MMRLRLTIERHGIPPVHVLWTVAPLRVPLATAGSSITISQFLEQVNDIIPLESEDWGLEDYAVEVGGFECLHFSELGQVLKNDEVVCVRALQTNDLRIRRISGRHQISTDGKHLIDGVAFGRPYLRRTTRPAINLPPRKRRRITSDGENVDHEYEVNDRLIAVRSHLDGEGEAVAEDESDDDEDFIPDDDENGDMSADVESLQDELDIEANEDAGASLGNENTQIAGTTTRRSRRAPDGLGLLRLVDEDGYSFTGEYSNPLLDQYGQYEPLRNVRKRGTASLAPRARRSARNGVLDSFASPERVPRRESAGSNKSVRFEENELETPATILESVDSEEDDDYEPDEVGESDKENTEPGAEGDDSNNVRMSYGAGTKVMLEDRKLTLPFQESYESSASASSRPSEDIDSDETSSSGSSSSESTSESDSDSEPEHMSTKGQDDNSDSSDTSSSGTSSSSNSSDSEPQKIGESQKPGHADEGVGPSCLHRVKDYTLSRVPPPLNKKPIKPGEGKPKTRKRNQRRKRRLRLDNLKRLGLISAEANISDLIEYEEGRKPENAKIADVEMLDGPVDNDLDTESRHQSLVKSSLESKLIIDVTGSEAIEWRDFQNAPNETQTEAKRQSLLTLIRTGGVQANQGLDSQSNCPVMVQTDENLVTAERARSKDTSNRDKTTIDSQDSRTASSPQSPHIMLNQGQSLADGVNAVAMEKEKEPMDDSVVASGEPTVQPALEAIPTPPSQQRRSKLDLGGAKRMLFGSLGLKTPKTRQDESETRVKLMKDVRPVRESQSDKELKTAEDIEAIAADDSWKDKIDLRAVECCHEGIELSTPPFPFVQRWDPQQQGGYGHGHSKKRKSKKRKRNNDNFYDESWYLESQSRIAPYKQGEMPETGLGPPLTNENPEDPIRDFSPERNMQDSQAVDEQLLRETAEVSAGTLIGNDELSDDLPTLPEDPTACLPLTREIARKGAVIAFRHLEMSAETNWQPNISNYRTAIVDQVTEKGELYMTPAKRDRGTKQSLYDEETGERLYGKFEMPGYNDEEEAEDIDISFDELINPILLRAADGQTNEPNEIQDHANVRVATPSVASGMFTAQISKENTDQQALEDNGAENAGNGDLTIEPNRETREDISQLIKAAGWRSSVQSGVNDGLDGGGDLPFPAREDNQEDIPIIDHPSPQFNGFSSSPAINVRSSPPIQEDQAEKRVHASGAEIAESVPPQDLADSDAKSVISETRSAIRYPSLPQLGDDSELYQEEAQQRSGLLSDDQIPSQDLISNGMDQSPAQSTRSHHGSSQASLRPDSNPPKAIPSSDAFGSEDEFPEPFSQAWENRMSQVREIKPESSQEDVISPPSYWRAKVKARHSSSQRESNRTWKPEDDLSALEDDDEYDEDDGASTPRPSQSQTQMSSQIVDLTISSDTVEPVDDDDDSYRLPKGPGWVSKSRTSRERSVSSRVKTGRVKRESRSGSLY